VKEKVELNSNPLFGATESCPPYGEVFITMLASTKAFAIYKFEALSLSVYVFPDEKEKGFNDN
jgi:hypothetical protein